MLPGTARHAAYDQLQRSLCYAVNWRCHYNMTRIVAQADPLLWERMHLPALRGRLEREMALIAGARWNE